MIPCISKNTIKLLAGTADERYNFSSSFFRKTHFPQTLNRYYNNKLLEKVTEIDLLEELKEFHLFGNRVYFIFGSTGSGKSEFLCWLKDQWRLAKKEKERPVIRISRSELNPQVLIKKCYEELGVDLKETIIDQNKWDILIKKPVSIMNQIIWNTLSELFEDDEEIVNFAFLLRPVIERNIKEFATNITKKINSTPLKILSESDFKDITESTTIPINVNYIILLDTLSKNLDYFLFNGHSISNLLKGLSNYLLENKIRPLLLIDDLVQSINIYAADILDHFITLEEGNWDVVIGLTPGVLQESSYNQDLIRRIQTLDTIDDRVKKFWLTDESGQSSYTIKRDQSQKFLENYLSALKEANGFSCSENCPYANNCNDLLISNEAKIEHLPFNHHLINRIFDGVSQGKGVLRYMILNSKELLNFLLTGNHKSTMKVQKLIHRDCFVSYEDETIKLLGEMYADSKGRTVILPLPLLKQFQHPIDSDLMLPVRKLLYQNIEIDDKKEVTVINNNGSEHVRDWIEGKVVKSELLDPVRLGVATLMNDVLKATAISRKNTARAAKTSPTIQKTEIIKRSKYPISFKSNSKNQILVKKHINLLTIYKFQKLKISERPEVFQEISDDINISQWFYQTIVLQKKWIEELETELTMPASTFVYNLRYFIHGLYALSKKDWTEDVKFPIDVSLLEPVNSMFLDWFVLRDNIIDYDLLSELHYGSHFEGWFSTFQPSKRVSKFSINNIPFISFINELQKEVKNYLSNLTSIYNLHLDKLSKMSALIYEHSYEKHTILENLLDNQNEKELSLHTISSLDELLSWCEEEGINEKYELLVEKQLTLQYFYDKFLENVKKSMEWLEDHGIQLQLGNFQRCNEVTTLGAVEEDILKWSHLAELAGIFYEQILVIPVHLLADYKGNCDVLGKRMLDKWDCFLEAGIQICNGIYNEQTFKHLKCLVDIDFIDLLATVEKRKKVIENAKILLPSLQTVNYEIDDVDIYLKDKLKVRPQLRHHLLQMIENGDTKLPPTQWRGIIRDLELLCPETYSEVSVSLSINKRN